jgi:CHAD domain-containing protein
MSGASAPEKWFVGLEAQAPVVREAPIVLQRRLEAVAERVGDVIRSQGRDDKAVHQLRVSTRRAQATILSFKPWLRKTRRKRVKRVLRRLREVAAVVRMCDVHRGLLRGRMESDNAQLGAMNRTVCELALLILAREREAALTILVRTARRVPVKRLTVSAERLVRRADESAEDAQANRRWPRDSEVSFDASVGVAGHAALGRIAGEFREASHADLTCRADLHKLRLCGKRLRYALEIFGPAEEDQQPLARLAEQLAGVQERLGEVNDHHEVAERLQRYANEACAAVGEASTADSTVADALRALSRDFEVGSERLAASFLQWWRSEDAGGFHRLIDMLAGRDPAPPAQPECQRVPEVVVVAGNSNSNRDAEAASSGKSLPDKGPYE